MLALGQMLRLLAWAAALSAIVCAQAPTIRTDVPLVVVPTSVTDKKGHYIPDLTDADFLLYDRQKPQTIHVDSGDTTLLPISLVIAIQTSGVSGTALLKLHKIGSMVQPLLVGERGDAAVITFDDEVKVTQSFTSDPDKIDNAFRLLVPGDDMSGRMIDAVSAGVRMLAAKSADRRRILIVVSESRDRGSTETLLNALALAQRESVTIYPITYSAYKTPFTTKASDMPTPPPGTNLLTIFTELGRRGKKNAAEALAVATGGKHVSFATLGGLEEVVANCADDIHYQYLLSFSPAPSPDSDFHGIQVKVRDRPDLIIRARPGYWPAQPPK